MGFTTIPTQANFIYFDVGMDGGRMYDALLRQGVIVRHIRGSMIRVTIGQPTENRRFLEALKLMCCQPYPNPLDVRTA